MVVVLTIFGAGLGGLGVHYWGLVEAISVLSGAKRGIRPPDLLLIIVNIGQLGEARVNIRELYKPAIISNSASLIIGHYYPAGSMEASPEDPVITGKT